MRTILFARVCLGGVCGWLSVLSAASVGWRVDGNGRFPDAQPPTTWAVDKGVVWKLPTKDWSNACPVLVGDRLFICAEPATLLCVNAADGALVWEKSVSYYDLLKPEDVEKTKADVAKAEELTKALKQAEGELGKANAELKKTPDDAALKQQVEDAKKKVQGIRDQRKPFERFMMPETHPVNGHATPTPVSDGKSVWVLFGTGMAACFDLDGNRKWVRLVEKPTHGWGHSSSAVLAGNTLVVPITKLYGLDPATGETRWEIPSALHWGSAVATRIADTDVVVTANGELVRAADGKVLASGLASLAYNSPIIDDGVVYFIQNGSKAYRLPSVADGSVKPELLWETQPEKEPKDIRYYGTPLYNNGFIYAITQQHAYYVIDAKTGAVAATRKLELGGTIYPSITLGGKYLYVSDDTGKTLVLEPGVEYKEVAANKLEPFRTCPWFAGKRMYIRTVKNLFCFGE